MEPMTLTASAIAALAFSKAFEKTIEKFTESAWNKIDDLRKMVWDKVKSRFQADQALEGAAKGSEEDVETVGDYLKIIMKEEPEFAKQLELVAQEIQAGKLQDNSTMTQINQDNARGWQTKVAGGTAYIGEIHINEKSANIGHEANQ
jgi:hypothetical protein